MSGEAPHYTFDAAIAASQQTGPTDTVFGNVSILTMLHLACCLPRAYLFAGFHFCGVRPVR